MAATYFDSSAIVKLVRRERRFEEVAETWTGADTAFASRLATVEVHTALGASNRTSELSAAHLAALLARASRLRQDLTVVELAEPIELLAQLLGPRHQLKGADAVHLASALVLDDASLVFATWDRRLHRAASAEGLAVAPASL